jgi:hypothetical protein
MDGWVSYYSIAMISQPMKAQLSALIYEKSLRRKNVKSAEKSADDNTTPSSQADENAGAGNPSDAEAGNGAADGDSSINGKDKGKTNNLGTARPEDESSVLKSRQAIVNLVGVDTNRISNFAAVQFIIVNSLGKLIVYSAFLITIIGWIPFTAGITAWALMLPLNTYFSRRYVRLSEKLMKVRDDKLAVVNEALLGMRQIKFAALEEQWEKHIMDWREKELSVTWQVFLGAGLPVLFCWLLRHLLPMPSSTAS